MKELTKLIVELTNAAGPSGYEKEVREIFRSQLMDCAEIGYDNLGSIIASQSGTKANPRILLAAHLDEVGLMVRGILPNGYLKVVPLGTWWAPTLLAQRVLVLAQTGKHYGVMGAKPPHYMSDEERNRALKLDDLYIDVGARDLEEVRALGIKEGDLVVPDVKTEMMSPTGTLVGKAFDDRIGCAAIIQVLRELAGNHPNQLFGAGTAQEEFGTRGAHTVAELVQPDLCLVIEGAPADDFPQSGSIIQGRLGGGVQLRYLDPTMIANRALMNLAVETAIAAGIPYQIAVREGGGTDGRVIQLHGGGVPTLVIGVPVRYAHSHQGIIQLSDVEAMINLLKELVVKLDAATVEQLKLNPY